MGVTSAANHFWQIHRQIFLTECTLTGSLAPRRLPRVLHPGGQVPHGARQLFLTNRTLTGSRPSFLRRASRAAPASERRPEIRFTVFFASIASQRYLAYCAPRNSVPAFSHRSHYDWAHNFPYLQPRYCWTYARHNHSVAVRFDSKEISHYKCPL